jgi:hypothetical protein
MSNPKTHPNLHKGIVGRIICIPVQQSLAENPLATYPRADRENSRMLWLADQLANESQAKIGLKYVSTKMDPILMMTIAVRAIEISS